MKSLTVTIFILFFSLMNGNSQTNLTKNEILSSWAAANKADTIKDLSNVTINPKTKKRIIEFIDSLNSKGIDTIIIYTIAYRGYFTKDSCLDYVYPIYSYLLWISNNEVNNKTIRGKCESAIMKINSPDIFEFYKNNKESIKKEIIMPVILNAQRTKENNINYSIVTLDNDPNYSIYFLFGNSFKIVNFTQSDMQNENSLFHDYNLNLKSIQLWKLIKKEIGDSRD